MSTDNSLFCISMCIVQVVAQHRNMKKLSIIILPFTKVKWGRRRAEREKLCSAGRGAKPFDTVLSGSKLRLMRTELLRLLWSTAHKLHLKGKGHFQCNLHSIILNKLLGSTVENFKCL